MKLFSSTAYIFLLICILLPGIGCVDSIQSAEEPEEEPEVHSLEIMTFNIRGDKASDGENQWQYRKDRVANLIKRYNPSILGLQEAKPPQLAYLDEKLEDYTVSGGGSRAGEYTVFMYDTTMVKYIEGSEDFIWLSETPDQQSVGWDAEHIRILRYAAFKDFETGDTLFAFNTHFDHKGAESRQESAKLVISTIEEVADGYPVVLMGDFNLTEDSTPYGTLTDPFSNLKNAFYITETPHRGPETRSSGFSVSNHSDKKPIDFIFVNDKIRVLAHAFLTDSYNGNYPSDHLPVLAEIEIIQPEN